MAALKRFRVLLRVVPAKMQRGAATEDHLGPLPPPDRLAAISAMRASIASMTARTRLVGWTSGCTTSHSSSSSAGTVGRARSSFGSGFAREQGKGPMARPTCTAFRAVSARVVRRKTRAHDRQLGAPRGGTATDKAGEFAVPTQRPLLAAQNCLLHFLAGRADVFAGRRENEPVRSA